MKRNEAKGVRKEEGRQSEIQSNQIHFHESDCREWPAELDYPVHQAIRSNQIHGNESD
jgi:hypothetical protein